MDSNKGSDGLADSQGSSSSSSRQINPVQSYATPQKKWAAAEPLNPSSEELPIDSNESSNVSQEMVEATEGEAARPPASTWEEIKQAPSQGKADSQTLRDHELARLVAKREGLINDLEGLDKERQGLYITKSQEIDDQLEKRRKLDKEITQVEQDLKDTHAAIKSIQSSFE